MYMVKNKRSKTSKYSQAKDAIVVKRLIIGIICATIIAVAVAIACKFLLNEEKLSKDRMESMAREYYEGYLYENLIHGAMDQSNIEQAMEKYALRGFAPVYLRQLLVDDGDQGTANLLRSHCDINTTSVKFYPESPYDKKSYRMEFQYDCDF